MCWRRSSNSRHKLRLSLWVPVARLFTNQFSSATGVRPQLAGEPLSSTQSVPVGFVVPV